MSARRPPPLLTTEPTRLAGLSRPVALGILAALIALVVAALMAPPVPAGPAEMPGVERQTDLMLYHAIIAGVRGGGDYYSVAADALRNGGYPLKPFVAFRLPTLAVVQATLPLWATTALLWMLVGGVLMAWWERIAPALTRPPARVAAGLLLLGGSIAFWQTSLAPFHELWAGLFIALSLARRQPDRPFEAIAWALAAMTVRETAALYALVMAAAALVEGRRREAVGWGAALAIFAALLALHAHAVSLVVRPLDPASPGWTGLLGFGFFVSAWARATAFSLLPTALAALAAVLTLLGWAGWRGPVPVRMLATLAAYAVLIGGFARADTFYWALLIAPASLVGLVFAPDALRDLATAALDRRRITVRRVVR